MKLIAKVVAATGQTRHSHGRVEDGVVVEKGELPKPMWVQIVPDEGAYLLLYLDENGDSLTDTWHETIEDAKAQAAFEFDIAEHDWNSDDAQRR